MKPEQTHFLKNEYLPLLRMTTPSTQALWGKMNFQQMLEHMSDSVRIASGKDTHQLHTPVELLEKAKIFMMSDKPFRENTKNVMMGAELPAIRNVTINDALDELQNELNYFFEFYELNKTKTVLNPIFGKLNFNENIHLIHKHALHHLKQFGIE